jgi:hypothetical protein
VYRRGLAIALDLLAIGFAALAAAVAAAGGFILEFQDFRLSFRTPSRTLLWMVLAVAARVCLDRRTGPLGTPRALWPSRLISARVDPLETGPAPGAVRRAVAASLGIAAALGVLLHDQLRHLYWVPDLGDPLFSMWRIGWVLHQLAANPAHLFDANIFYPEPLTLTFSDPIVVPALMAAPMLAVGLHPIVAYNVLLLSGFWLSGIATYLLVERLTRSPRAAFVAGLIYACYSFRFDHYSHLELQMTQWMPLALLALHSFVSTGRWPYAMAVAVAGVAQLYSSMYYAVFFVVYVAAVAAGLLLVHRPPVRRLIMPIAAAAVVAAVLAVPIVRAFIAAQPVKGERPELEIRYYSATPLDYLRANRLSATWRDRIGPPLPERALFPGAAPLAIAAVGLAPPITPVSVVYAGALLVSIDGSFGMNGVLYPLLHYWLTPFRGIRSPARYGALVGLTLSVLAGFGAARILRRCRSRVRAHVVFGAAIAAVVIDAWPALGLMPAWTEPPPIYAPLRNKADVVLAEFPVMSNEASNLPFMYFSLWHWSPMVNGYSGFIPDSYQQVAPDLIEFPRGDSIARLRRRGITHVTVICGLWDATCEDVVRQVRQSGELQIVTETQWQGRAALLYELTRR